MKTFEYSGNKYGISAQQVFLQLLGLLLHCTQSCWAQRADAQLHEGLGKDGGLSLCVSGTKMAKYSSGTALQLCRLCFLIASDFQDFLCSC